MRRELNREDRRSFIVHLSAPGRRAARKIASAMLELDRELASAVDPGDLADLETIVRELEHLAGRR